MNAVANQPLIRTNMNVPTMVAVASIDPLVEPSSSVDFKLTTKTLKNIYGATTTDVLPFIVKHMLTYEINTRVRMAAFLASCFVMSAGFRRKVENYSFTADRLYKECHKVDSLALARRLMRNGEKEIANYLFSFENGNGGIDSNDGWMFRARSPLQFRGRNTYELIHKISGIDCVEHPEIIEELENSIIAAMIHWQDQGYNELSDKIKFSNSFELDVKLTKAGTKNYRSNGAAVKMKKKLSGDTTALLDFCNFIEMGMLYL